MMQLAPTTRGNKAKKKSKKSQPAYLLLARSPTASLAGRRGTTYLLLKPGVDLG